VSNSSIKAIQNAHLEAAQNQQNIQNLNHLPVIQPAKPQSVSPVSSISSDSRNHDNGTAISIINNNQTDYFRNCNVPNLINKWRRRHTWLFLKEGKMFCQVGGPYDSFVL
jgi:hypothetical protein